MARPETPIDWNLVDKFIQAGSKPDEIAGHFRLTKERFLDRVTKQYGINYTHYSVQVGGSGQALLRLAQFNKAMNNSAKGNTQMLIWLGKVVLGQREPEAIKERPPNDDQLELFIKNIKAAADEIKEDGQSGES